MSQQMILTDNPVEIVDQSPQSLFDGTVETRAFLEALESQYTTTEADLSTDAARKRIASMAYQIAKRKTAIDNAGKDVKEDAQKRVNEINEIRRSLKSSLENLQDRVRQPLTQWEKQEQARKDSCNAIMATLRDLGSISFDDLANDIRDRLSRAKNVEVLKSDFQEIFEQASELKASTLDRLESAALAAEKREQEAAELAELRRKQQEAEAEQQRRDREAAEEKQRIEREKQLADNARREAEMAAQAELDRQRREHEAEMARVKAEQEAKERAAKQEQERLERERLEAERVEAVRVADQKHRTGIMSQITIHMINTYGMGNDDAKSLTLAMVNGKVPNVKVIF